jgi:MFS family permease
MRPKLLQFPQVVILMVMFSFLSLAAVVFTPAFPELSREFHLHPSQEQWMMTIFLLGMAIGRLPYGPMANRYGRKNTLYIGLFISLIGTAFTLFADTYVLICLGRFIQACGCAVTLKIGYTMVGDLHAGPAVTKVLSYALLAYAILPGIGTAISGFLIPYFGWRGGFWFFLLFTLIFALSCPFLPETSTKRDLHSLRIKNIARAYAEQFKDLNLVLWGCLMGLSTGVLFIFAQEAPFLAADQMGISPQEYGVFYLVPAFGIAGGSFATVWLADKMSILNAMLLGILTILVGALLMGIFFLSSWFSGWALFLPQVIVQFGDAILYTNASSIALSEAKDKSNASAVMLFISALCSVASTFLVGVFIPRTLLSLPIVFIAITAIMLLIWLKLYKK